MEAPQQPVVASAVRAVRGLDLQPRSLHHHPLLAHSSMSASHRCPGHQSRIRALLCPCGPTATGYSAAARRGWGCSQRPAAAGRMQTLQDLASCLSISWCPGKPRVASGASRGGERASQCQLQFAPAALRSHPALLRCCLVQRMISRVEDAALYPSPAMLVLQPLLCPRRCHLDHMSESTARTQQHD